MNTCAGGGAREGKVKEAPPIPPNQRGEGELVTINTISYRHRFGFWLYAAKKSWNKTSVHLKDLLQRIAFAHTFLRNCYLLKGVDLKGKSPKVSDALLELLSMPKGALKFCLQNRVTRILFCKLTTIFDISKKRLADEALIAETTR